MPTRSETSDSRAALLLLESAIWNVMADLVNSSPALADDAWRLLARVQGALTAGAPASAHRDSGMTDRVLKMGPTAETLFEKANR